MSDTANQAPEIRNRLSCTGLTVSMGAASTHFYLSQELSHIREVAVLYPAMAAGMAIGVLVGLLANRSSDPTKLRKGAAYAGVAVGLIGSVLLRSEELGMGFALGFNDNSVPQLDRSLETHLPPAAWEVAAVGAQTVVTAGTAYVATTAIRERVEPPQAASTTAAPPQK